MGARLASGGGKYSVPQNSEINVTPFVDIMLVLLIIFMVAMPVATTSIKLDMPPAEGGNPGKLLFISVMGPDALYIGDHKTSLASLDADVRAALQSSDPYGQRIQVRGDKDIAYGDFVAVMDDLHQHGYQHVALITEDIQ